MLRRRGRGGADWRTHATAMLAEVEITDTAPVLPAYPHQLSGGMLQRVLIALVLAGSPAVVVADEPTTNLDNIVERQVLRLFRRLKHPDGAAFLFITHDMKVAASLCDHIAVMYAGELIEIGPTRALFGAAVVTSFSGLVAYGARRGHRFGVAISLWFNSARVCDLDVSFVGHACSYQQAGSSESV